MIDIRAKFNEVVTKYGHPILLVRNADKVKCSCWDMTYGADKNCPKCLGTGYLFKAERYMARDMKTAIPETLARSIRDTDFGSLAVPSRAFYLEYFVRPDIQDYIIDCGWDERGRPIFDEYSGVYEINFADPQRGDNGRIEYFRAACKYDPVAVTGIKAYITANVHAIVYNVAIGGI